MAIKKDKIGEVIKIENVKDCIPDDHPGYVKNFVGWYNLITFY